MAWSQVNDERWERGDGAVVKIDHTTEANSSRPWLLNYRGWMAFGPGDSQHNYLGFKRRNSMFNIPRKFKTAESAMISVDAEFPEKR